MLLFTLFPLLLGIYCYNCCLMFWRCRAIERYYATAVLRYIVPFIHIATGRYRR